MQKLSLLKSSLDDLAANFGGVLGYSLHHRGTGEEIELRGDERFPTASTIKTAVMCEVMDQVDKGRLKWSEQYEVQPGQDKRSEGGYAYLFMDGSRLPLPNWVEMMITVSCNTSTMKLRELAGMANVNRWLAEHGFQDTMILNGAQKAELGLLELNAKYGLGMTTPNEMRRLLEMIRDGAAGSPAACDRMLRILCHQFWDNGISSQIPPEVQVASKGGAVSATRSEAAFVFAPSGEYVLTVYTRDQTDRRWAVDNEGELAIREVSRVVWTHFHPEHPWRRPEGADGFDAWSES